MGAGSEDRERAEAEKVAAEAKKAKADARRAELEIEKAEGEARKTRVKLDEYDSAAARAARLATSSKTIAEADADAAAARRRTVSAIVPDLSEVKPGSLKADGTSPLYGSTLAYAALDKATTEIAHEIRKNDGVDLSKGLLVTADPALINSDAEHSAVRTGLDHLNEAARAMLARLADELSPVAAALDGNPERPEPPVEPVALHTLTGFTPLDAAAAIASAVPSVLSLFSANRSISTSTPTVDDNAAAASLLGKLLEPAPRPDGAEPTPSPVLHHDQFRLVPAKGHIDDALTGLRARRATLARASLGLAAGSDKATAKVELDGLMSTIDLFLNALMTSPGDGKAPPVVAAKCREALHPTHDSGPPAIAYVLLVKSVSASAQQVLDDKPLWFKDKFTVLASLSITYVLIASATSNVLAAGTKTASATVSGSVGSDFVIRTKCGSA